MLSLGRGYDGAPPRARDRVAFHDSTVIGFFQLLRRFAA